MPKQPSSAPDVAVSAEVALAVKALAPAVKRLTVALGKVDAKKMAQGACADLLYDLRNVGKTLNALAAPFSDVVDPMIKELENHFVDSLAVGESSGIQGMRSRVQITESVVPTLAPEGKEAFYKYVARTKQWDLLPAGVSRAAVMERWTDKKQVPGVGRFIAKKVSCTKLNGKNGKS